MHWNTSKPLAGLTAVLLLTGCASNLPPSAPEATAPGPVVIPAPNPAPIPAPQPTNVVHGNVICNHQFDANQIAFEPDFVETENNSIIDGDTSRALLRSLGNAIPYRGAGNTQWTISWAYDTDAGAGSCSVIDPEVRVVVDYHLPLWPDQINATNRVLASRWNEYSDALRVHHCRHGKTGIDAAVEVTANLEQLVVVSGSCERLKLDADALARSIINTYKQAESRFVPPVITDYLR